MPDVKARPRSSLRAERAEATRARIAEAARHLFATRGYGATTLAAVAAEAGVAVQTVYAVYRSKAGILRVLQAGVVRQPEAGALFERSLSAVDPAERLDLFAASIRARWELGQDVVSASLDAARTEPEVRADVARIMETRRAGIGRVAAGLAGSLRPGLTVERAAAILDALTLPELYAELVGLHGWSPDEFEHWLAATLRDQLLADAGREAAGPESAGPGG